MATGKRSFVEFAAGSEPNLTVLTTDGGSIPAHNDVLRLVCSCLRNAPASDTWDLSSLLVNGRPVGQSTVTAVLSVTYSSMGSLGYDPPHAAGQHSLAQLLEMLLFADAVGCSRAVLTALASLLSSGRVRPQLEVPMPATLAYYGDHPSADTSSSSAAAAAGDLLVLLLRLDGVYEVDHYELCPWPGDYEGEPHVLHQDYRFNLLPKLDVKDQHKQLLLQQVCQQLEALLWVGFKLDLQQLLAPALRFARANAPFILRSVVCGYPNAVFSQRVLNSMSGANSSNAAVLMRGWLQQQLGLRHFTGSDGAGGLFTDVVYNKARDQNDNLDRISFHGTLTRNVYSLKAGTKVWVTLFGGEGSIGEEGSYAGLHFGYDVVLGPMHMFSSMHADLAA